MEDDEQLNEPDNRDRQPDFYGKYTYDNVHQFKIEEEYPNIVAKITEARNRDILNLREDPSLVKEIAHLLTKMIELADKYDSVADIKSDDIIDPRTVDPMTGEGGVPFTLESFAKYVDRSSRLPTMKVGSLISELGRKYVVIMGKRAAMRKARSDKLPFLLRVGQKLQFTKWMDEETEFIEKNKIQGIHRVSFLVNHYRVIEDGEVNMLMSGENKSGKTGTSIRLLINSWRDLNGYFRPFIEDQLAAGKYIKVDGSTYRKFEDLVPPKFRLKDHLILLDRKQNLGLLASSPFPDLLYDEGNFTNINLKSMDPETIDETIAAFGARNKHAFTIYNYQNSNRPTLFLREKFNMWFHKIHMQNGFWLIRQRLIIPPKDPWLVKRLDKIIQSGSDEAIYGFFKRHPYTMREFKNIRDMPPKMRFRYEIMRQKAQAEKYQATNAAALLAEARQQLASELAMEIEAGHILYSSIDSELTKRGITSLAERARIKNFVNGLMSHANIMAALGPKKAKKPSEGVT